MSSAMNFTKLLIAVENAPLALKVAKEGFRLAEDLKAEVSIIHVIDLSHGLGNVDAGILPDQALAKLKQQGEELISQLVEMYGKNLHPFHFMPEGKPAEEILLMVKEWEADILVIGTHGKTGLRKLLMGSIAEAIIRHCPCPVLIVNKL